MYKDNSENLISFILWLAISIIFVASGIMLWIFNIISIKIVWVIFVITLLWPIIRRFINYLTCLIIMFILIVIGILFFPVILTLLLIYWIKKKIILKGGKV